MRLAPFLLALACGAPAFTPVALSLRDDDVSSGYRYFLVAVAEKKANPTCTANCELEQAIEDGGCNGFTLSADGGFECPAGGGVFLPFFRSGTPDGGTAATERNIAPGATLKLTLWPEGVAACTKSYEVGAGGLDIALERTAAGDCTFTTR